MDGRTLTRQALYEAVWTTPIVQLAKQYNLSDVGLAKVCARHEIPRPGPGFWAKRAHGKKTRRPQLPVATDSKLEVVVLSAASSVSSCIGSARFAEDEEVNTRIAAEMSGPSIIVPEKLRNPHPLVVAAMDDDRERAAEARRLKAGAGWSEIGARERADVARANISASTAMAPRAYRIMNALLRAAEERGFEVTAKADRHRRSTNIKVLGTIFDVRIYEPSQRRPHVLTREEEARKRKSGHVYHADHDFVLSGQLCIQLRAEGGWTIYWQARDGKKARVERRLGELFIAALRRIDESRKWQRIAEADAAARREAERLRQAEADRQLAIEEARRKERERVQLLLDQAASWRQSRELREYLVELRRVMTARGVSDEPGSDLERWLRWAEGVAVSLDPLRPTDR